MRILKVLYGNLRVALFLWKDLTGILNYWVFELKPYDKYVANKNIDVSHCTILCKLDNLKIYHK